MDLTAVPGRADGSDDTSNGRGPLLALRMARVIVAVVFCGFGGTALLWVLESGKRPGEVVLAAACLCGLLSLQYFYFGNPATNLRSPPAYAMLAVQACLAYLPLPLFGQAWVSQPPFLAGSVLLVLPPRVAWPMYAGVVASTGFTQSIVDFSWLNVGYIVVNSATAGLFVYGLTRLARLVTALHEARGELAKTAVAHERLRLARDLHDLLGSSLSAIAPKVELILQRLRRDPERARQELSEILRVSRRALADVRSMVRLYQENPLGDETGALASMLAESNVELRMDLDLRGLPPRTRSALAAVLREGVAYLLRHRPMEHCEIVLGREGDTVSVDIIKEAADGRAGAAPTGEGRGFDELSATVSRLAGEVSVEAETDGRVRLHVTLPVAARSPQGPAEPAEGPRAFTPHVATRLAGALVVAVLCGLSLQAAGRLGYETQNVGDIALGTAYVIPVLVLQLAYFSRPGARLRSPVGYLLLGLQALLVYVPLLQLQLPWTGLQGFVAGSALLVLRPALGWSVFVAVVASVAWVQIGYGDVLPPHIRPRHLGQNILITLDMGLIVYGLTWMARTVRQLRAVRQELAQAALAETRLRFVRDLHDLLGLSLSAIALKCDLAHRLILRDAARARAELEKVRDVSRRALADVRSVASGYHEMSLEEECGTAQSLLATAELDVRMDLRYGDLPPEVATVLATVLREGVTNVLRHSKGTFCEITVRTYGDEVRLHIVNDGVTESPEEDHWGSGIRNMSDRVAALGGVLTAEFEGGGRFRLSARVPLLSREPPATPP
ncbi:sensor histidine kinase [Nonomuraea sp. SYSU D8015]|uniref:sensor histidine kinase n=1 Tax=Nonomuraea sp. SYSU D8015 TaxID=2593644 RepID=UPI0016604593|nr:histidine kinase [Nonomuraea sp. SYSU D8015]